MFTHAHARSKAASKNLASNLPGILFRVQHTWNKYTVTPSLNVIE